jgi:signal transduction histidine kinase
MTTDTCHVDMLRLIQRALPVESVSSLLDAIAQTWDATTQSTGCFVSLLHDGRIEGLLIRTGESQRISQVSDTWTASVAAEALASSNGSATLDSMTLVPFEFSHRQLGGVLLFGSLDVEHSEHLADVSARLIEQLNRTSESAAARSASLAETDPLSPDLERRLRDLKLEAMAEFSAGAGHEINNPVATIVGRSGLLLRSETDPDRRRGLETIGGQALRIRDMIGDAMTFARPPEPACETIIPAGHIRSVIDSLGERLSLQGTELHCELDESIHINADREQFCVVVSCLVRNSLEALRASGHINVTLLTDSKDPGMARLIVQDDGPGLTQTETEHLFDPFFSGRQAGRGLGFGLARCWQILRQHDGWIDVMPECGEDGFGIQAVWPLARETQ